MTRSRRKKGGGFADLKAAVVVVGQKGGEEVFFVVEKIEKVKKRRTSFFPASPDPPPPQTSTSTSTPTSAGTSSLILPNPSSLALTHFPGTAHAHPASMPRFHSLPVPLLSLEVGIRKNPSSPQARPHELRTIQYSTGLSNLSVSPSGSSTPQPTTETRWLISGCLTCCLKILLLPSPSWPSSSSVASMPQEMGPRE